MGPFTKRKILTWMSYFIILLMSFKLSAQMDTKATHLVGNNSTVGQIYADSLYPQQIFDNIENNSNLELYTKSELFLENFLINENYYLKKHPKLILQSTHDLAQFYSNQTWSSKVFREISNHYYRHYFSIIKKIKLTPEEDKIAKLNKLRFMVRTNNDSVFYYLSLYKLTQKLEADILNEWYKKNADAEKELFYAKILGDKIKIITALKNNNKYPEIEELYPSYLKEFKETDITSEHKLYLLMGDVYNSTERYKSAEKMYLKALHFFELKENHSTVNLIYNGLKKNKLHSGDLAGHAYYTNKLFELSKSQEELQLIVLKNHLDYSKRVSDLSIQLKLEAEKLKNSYLRGEIKTQKVLISFALALIIVILIFVYFYSVYSKSKAKLEYANKQMIIDVLRSKFKPHFTFNVLSVINYFVEKKEVQNATLALTKMSSLLRATLDNMSQKLVPYLSEYQICENYMYLESLRFSEKFVYEFEPIENITIQQWMIPPGIIEPILENAVNHAFTGVRYKGKILLRHRIENNKLLIVVEDNGIGFKTSSLIEKKSHGLKITKDHIKVISKLYNSNIKLNIKSNKKGTYVEITIPKLNKLER